MFNSKKLKTRPANYAASHAINLEEDWTRRGKKKKKEREKEERKLRKEKKKKKERRRDDVILFALLKSL